MRSNLKHSLSILLTACFLFLAAAAPGLAALSEPVAVDDLFWVDPTVGPSVTISFYELTVNDTNSSGEITLAQDPLHGTLSPVGDTFLYTPDSSFWSLGTDQFSYTLGGTSTATVRLLRRFPQEAVRTEHFELSANPPYSQVGAQPWIGELADARIIGSGGLRAQIEAGTGTGVWVDLGGDNSDDGGVTLLGCGFSQFPATVEATSAPNEIALLMLGPAGFTNEDASLRLVLSRGTGASHLRVEIRDQWQTGVFVSSASLPVPRDVAHLTIDWWSRGAVLSVDGLATTVLDVANAELDFSVVRLGLMPIGSGLSEAATFDFDAFELFRRALQPESTLLKVDNFESGDTASWSDRYGNGLLTTTAPNGERLLESNLDLGISYLVDTTPEAEDKFGARLRFDVSHLTMTPGDSFRLFDVGSSSGPLFGAPDLSLRLLGGTENRIYLVAFTSKQGVLIDSGWFLLSGAHTVELQLQTAASALVNSGLARIWLDGEVVSEMAGLDNEAQLVEWIHLGALGVDPGTSGVLLQDDFETWR